MTVRKPLRPVKKSPCNTGPPSAATLGGTEARCSGLGGGVFSKVRKGQEALVTHEGLNPSIGGAGCVVARVSRLAIQMHGGLTCFVLH